MKFIYVCILAVSLMPATAFSLSSQADFRYVISFKVSSKKNSVELSKYKNKYSVYQLTEKINGKITYTTRLGFFDSRKQATIFLKKIKNQYRSANIDSVKKRDEKHLIAWYKKKVNLKQQSSPGSSFLLDKMATSKIMEQARQFVVAHDYRGAIKLYTKILSIGDTEFKQDAQEFLAVAREKNGQNAHAKAEYKEYLRLYPEGEGADRVSMRLQAILTVYKSPRKKLAKPRKIKDIVWSTYGYLTEFYRYDKFEQNAIVRERSSLTTTLGVFSRRRSELKDMKIVVTGDYFYDLDDENDNRQRLTSLYFDYANKPKMSSVRLGRQRHTKSGVLGRMDGAWVDYRFHPQWKVNAVAGYPVDSFDSNKIQSNRNFYGISFDIGPFNKYWDFNFFQIEQEVDGLTDRKAIGGEVRYISPRNIFFTLLDYDTYFEEINKLYVVSTWLFADQKRLNVTYDKTKSPYLLATNALMGQQYRTLEDMRVQEHYSSEQMKQFAIDRTATSTRTTINGTAPISKNYVINIDLTASSLSGTPGSAGVVGNKPTGKEYYYGVQLIGDSVILKHDTMIASVRYSTSSTYNRNSYSISERVKLSDNWRSNVMLYYEIINKTTGAKTKTMTPQLGVDYLYSRSLKFEGDLSYEKSSTKGGGAIDTNDKGVYLSLGLVYDF